MVKIELRDFAGNILQRGMEFNQNTMSELDLLEKIDPDIGFPEIEAIKQEHYNDLLRAREGNLGEMEWQEMQEAKREHLKSQYFKGRFGKILARFNTQKGEVIVPLSYDPTIPLNPSGLGGVQGNPRFTVHGANIPSWDSIKKLSTKELLFNEKKKGSRKRKKIPPMDKPNFVKNLVLTYIPKVERRLLRWQHHGERVDLKHPAEDNEAIIYEHQEISPPQLSPSPLPITPSPPQLSPSPLPFPPPPPSITRSPSEPDVAAKCKKSTRRKRKSKRPYRRRSRRSL